jgi:hypothetical protein
VQEIRATMNGCLSRALLGYSAMATKSIAVSLRNAAVVLLGGSSPLSTLISLLYERAIRKWLQSKMPFIPSFGDLRCDISLISRSAWRELDSIGNI